MQKLKGEGQQIEQPLKFKMSGNLEKTKRKAHLSEAGQMAAGEGVRAATHRGCSRVRGLTLWGGKRTRPTARSVGVWWDAAVQRQGGLDPQLRQTAVTVCHKIRPGEGFHCRGCPGERGQGTGLLPCRGAEGDAGRRRNYRGKRGGPPQNATTGRRAESCFSSCLVALLNTARKEH